MADHTNPNPNPNCNVGGVGVPGAQVELMENMQSQSHQYLQQQQLQHDYAQQQLHQQQSAAEPPVQQHQQQQYYQQEPTRDPRQFDQQYQQSYYNQPTHGGVVQTNSATVDAEMAPPTVVPANTNVVGDGDPGFSVGGVGVPGARVETLDSMQPQTHYQQPVHQQQEHYIQQQHVGGGIGVPGQQSFFSQPTDSTTARQQYVQESTPVHHSTKDATDFHVGGLGVPGAHVEFLPTIEEQQSIMTPTTATGTAESTATATDRAAPPTIFLQREASMLYDHDTPITTSSTTTATATEPPPQKVHVASAGAVAAAQAAQAADAATRGRRRSSLAVLADKIRSSTRSRSRSPSLSRRLSRTISRHSFDDDEDDSVGGPYRDVKIAQQEHLAKLRAEQEKKGITHNADGIPIPPAPERQRRRSS
ncbi:hypothetical protein BGZ97_002834, partial [Linnemannia gamsii]